MTATFEHEGAGTYFYRVGDHKVRLWTDERGTFGACDCRRMACDHLGLALDAFEQTEFVFRLNVDTQTIERITQEEAARELRLFGLGAQVEDLLLGVRSRSFAGRFVWSVSRAELESHVEKSRVPAVWDNPEIYYALKG